MNADTTGEGLIVFSKVVSGTGEFARLKKKPHAMGGVEHRVLLQSVSEDDRPVTIVALDRHEINRKILRILLRC